MVKVESDFGVLCNLEDLLSWRETLMKSPYNQLCFIGQTVELWRNISRKVSVAKMRMLKWRRDHMLQDGIREDCDSKKLHIASMIKTRRSRSDGLSMCNGDKKIL